MRNGRLLADTFLLFCLYLVVAAAAFNGFYGKWTLRDDDKKFSLVAMVDGTAHRPYVYRQLMPVFANGVETLLPAAVTERLTASLYRAEGGMKSKLTSPPASDPNYTLRYHIIYYGTFLILLASLFVMREMCRAAGFSLLGSTAAPPIFALFVPLLQTYGGYFYDFSEILFMSAAILLALKGRRLWLIPLSIFATWNKESYLFFIIALYPLLRTHCDLRAAVLLMGILIAITAGTYFAVRLPYADNAGSIVQFHLVENLLYYANPQKLLSRDVTYGIKLFSGYSIVMLGLAGIVFVRGWVAISDCVREHILLAAAINLPLFILFCAPSEVRNLSMLFMGFVLLLAAMLDRWYASKIISVAGSPPQPRGADDQSNTLPAGRL